MDNVHKAVIASLIGTSALAWVTSINQPDMMIAMSTYNPLAISVFTASWTVGMAAMMFPAITPMVLLYNRVVIGNQNKDGKGSLTIQKDDKPRHVLRSLRIILFVGSYLLVWALTGIALLLGWSVVMNNTIMTAGNSQQLLSLYGALLIVAGVYQFTPIKKACIGYCESPLSFFMRRWKDGTLGAVKMGIYHGLYCLGCCWAYFLLMIALGWMSLLWMGLFAAIIFGEKIWSRGIWVARIAGLGLTVIGILVIAGMIPSLVSSASSMHVSDGNSMAPEMNDNIINGKNSSNSSMGGSEGIQARQDQSDQSGSAPGNEPQTMQPMDLKINQQMSDMNMK